MRRLRRAAALLIVTTAVGVAIEGRDARLWRAPFTGAACVAGAAAVAWATGELGRGGQAADDSAATA